MKSKEKVGAAFEGARPYVERLAKDEELHDHVKKAYDSAQKIYTELVGDSGRFALAKRVAADKHLQEELKQAVQELRKAGDRVRGHDSHKARNATLLLAGIAIGILFNPATGPDTRRWIKDKLFGAEEPFEYTSNDAA